VKSGRVNGRGMLFIWIGLLAVFYTTWVEADYVRGVPYFHQYSNGISPSGSCQNTCIAIVLKYYGAADVTPDRISSRWGTGLAKSTGGLAEVFNTEAAERGLTVRDEPLDFGTLGQLHAQLDEGKPVIVHGGFSNSGHLLVLLGYDERYYFIHDPAGRWTERVGGGFTSTGDADIGRYTRYDRKAVENAIISSDHQRIIRFHRLYFEPGVLAGEWEGILGDSLVAGETVALDESIRVVGAADGESPVVTADLSELGGEDEVILEEAEEGVFRLQDDLLLSANPGLKRISLQIHQETPEGMLESSLVREITLLPPQSQEIFTDGLGEGWATGEIRNADIELTKEQVRSGDAALALQASAFTLEFLPAEPIDPAGYRTLGFYFHPGDATAGARPAFTVQLNGEVRKLEKLIGGDLGVEIDLERREWQLVEIPMSAFYPLEDPITSIRLFGNLRGRFYLDELNLISGAFPAPAVSGFWESALPDSLFGGREIELRETVRVESTEADGQILAVTADLSELGGPEEMLLEQIEEGLYRLEARLSGDVPNGLRRVAIHIRQQTPERLLQTTLDRELVFVPVEDQVIFGDHFGENWSQGYTSNIELDLLANERVFSGEASMEVQAEAFTLEFLPFEPVEKEGYRALHFSFHPGDAVFGASQAFTVMLNQYTPAIVKLADGEGVEVAVERREWQMVEIPLEEFGQVEGPIESIRLLGNLQGTFYLDDMRLEAVDFESNGTTVVVEERQARPSGFELEQNYPNPFNSETVFRFSIPPGNSGGTETELAVFNLAGQKVRVLDEGNLSAGVHEVRWNGRDGEGRMLASGVYLYRLEAGTRIEMRKLLLLR
jgi:hypothetical protein